MPLIKFELVTKRQIEYIEILFIDLQIFKNFERLDRIYEIIGRDVKHIGDLTKVEATKVISFLKEWKDASTKSYSHLRS
jgi:hypothetical protein